MKKIMLSIMLLLPLGVVAQEMKIATVNTADIISIMPEITALENEIMALSNQYQNQLKILSDDHDRKYQELMSQQDSLAENIKTMRIQEIQEIQTRYENLQQLFMQDREKKQAELFAPIQEKLKKAIEQVGEENGYTYILNMHDQIILYVGKTAIDATDKVKTKLGLK